MSLEKILKNTLIIVSTIAVLLGLFVCRVMLRETLEYKSYNREYYEIEYTTYFITQEEAVDLVNKEFRSNCKPKFVDSLGDNVLGLTEPIHNRGVFLLKALSGWQTVEVYTHELIHYEEWVYNERMTEFLTFKILYESDNPILHNRGKAMAYNWLNKDENKVNKEYDCRYYIKEYLENERHNN